MKTVECRTRTLARNALAVLFVIQSLFFILPLAATAQAQEEASPTDYQVKALYLFNFGKFVDWPTNAFADAQAPLVIGIFGDDPFHGYLDQIVGRDKINGHPVEIRRISSLPDLKRCQILFIAASSERQEHEILDATKDLNMLTVGESKDFIRNGGMIQFIIEDRRVHFEINNEAARSAGLKISSKLLTLARQTGQSK